MFNRVIRILVAIKYDTLHVILLGYQALLSPVIYLVGVGPAPLFEKLS